MSDFPLRVATYNIHKGVLNDLFGLRRVPVIHDLRDRLHELDADLVFLQEVQGHHARNASRFAHWPSEPQHQFLARSASMRHVFESAYGNNANYLHGHHGNALLSRFPIVHRENRDISDHALEKRGVLHCVVTINRRAVHCFVVHFGLFARSRQRQLDVLIRWIRDEVARDAPVIVAGDFNDWQNRLSDRVYDELGLIEAFDSFKPRYRRVNQAVRYVTDRLTEIGLVEQTRAQWQMPRRVRGARTFPSLVPWLRMDRMYLRGFQVQRADVLRGPAWARLSDHSPLLVDLKLAAAADRAA